MMKKPIIGITPDYSYEKTRFKISEDYTNALLKAGGVPVLLFPGRFSRLCGRHSLYRRR